MKALVSIVVLLVASPAIAGRHGGHGGGGHHRGGSRGGGRGLSHRGHSYRYGTGYLAVTPSCEEKGTVLGYRTCSRFGEWDRVTGIPAVAVEVTSSARAYRTAPLSLAGATKLEDQQLEYMADASGGTVSAVGFGLRVTGVVVPSLYIGFETEAGPVTASPQLRVAAFSSEPVIASRSSFVRVAAIVGGYRDLGSTRIASELAAGGAATPVTARYADDPERGTEHEATLSWQTRPTVEARIRLDQWLSPWLTIGAFAGLELSSLGASAGLSLGVHMRAFDGGR